METETKTVVRIIEISGPSEWVDATVAASLHGTIEYSAGSRLTGVVLDKAAADQVQTMAATRDLLVEARKTPGTHRGYVGYEECLRGLKRLQEGLR